MCSQGEQRGMGSPMVAKGLVLKSPQNGYPCMSHFLDLLSVM